ncbi:carbonic anhydrase [Streptomyces sp. VRA16 Mangrove soil]|uniref:carbonic anhydrase n=1 Tax=Streptomyces sp. VRA16 Mangrove soil TaxID=2817434 RepID=UPI001A9FC163|nr:carbonic anhydrase [Streptomyces sp. VRA16 Mangrove soil]MBO1336604.1 carbonic anhydrase [Streptomyces sp. VRA16 Mangrove soil]
MPQRRIFLTATAALAPLLAVPAVAAPSPRPRSAHEALSTLLDGNLRYAQGRSRHPHQGRDVRQVLAAAQRPFAVVVGCVDSRVPPEIVFDQGLGDLLCIRTAGEVLDDAVLGSVQYGVGELGAPLVLVLGHERCGAVAAALAHVAVGAPAPGHLGRLVDSIAPAARACRGLPGDWADHTVRRHARSVRDTLRADPAIGGGGTVVAAARFDLDSGVVALLS